MAWTASPVTAIVGYRHNGEVWLGADSAGSDGWHVQAVLTPKLFKVGPALVAYTTSFRWGNILQHRFTPPKLDGDAARWVAVDFTDALRTATAEAGWLSKVKDREELGTALVAVDGRLFVFQDDLSSVEYARFATSGSGESYSLGAMWLAHQQHMEAQDVVKAGLGAAAEFATTVCKPFKIRQL